MKIQEQVFFVQWWRENVNIHHGGNRKDQVRSTWDLKDAEQSTGISNQQVSRWAKALQDDEAYLKRQLSSEKGDARRPYLFLGK